MNRIKLKKLTQKGTSKLKQKIDLLHNQMDPNININDYESEEVSKIDIEKNKIFDNKFAVGKYFLRVFPEGFNPCISTWNWLSILYYKQLLNKNKKLGELKRIFIDENHPYYPYRHLLKAPYDICQFYKSKTGDLKSIDFLLLDKVNTNGHLYRCISENQDIRKNPHFMEVARSFFYHEQTKSLKKDITDPIQRLIKIWKQYERSFDMYRMPSQAIIQKLLVKHDEFKQFI